MSKIYRHPERKIAYIPVDKYWNRLGILKIMEPVGFRQEDFGMFFDDSYFAGRGDKFPVFDGLQ